MPLISPSERDCPLSPNFSSGPVISPAAKKRVVDLISSCEEEGGKILLDGRNISVPAYPDGNFVGPTILEADATMRCYKYVHSRVIFFIKNMWLIIMQGGDIWTRSDRSHC
jgi:delta 1-pyrroline-5-carboxylate dehydrogenase